MNREVSQRMIEVAEHGRVESEIRRAMRAPIVSRADRAAGSCISEADKRPGEVVSVSIDDYLREVMGV